MEGNKESYYSLRDILNYLKLFLNYLSRKWWLLVFAGFAGAGIGALCYFIQKPKYEGACTFILEEKSSGSGSLAGLASQFGFDVGSLSGGGSFFAGDNILEIIRSKKIIQKVLLSKVDTGQGIAGTTLADLFLDFNGWNNKWANDSELKNISYIKYIEGDGLTLKQDSVLNLIHEFLLKKSLSAERLNKKGSIIKIQVTTSNNLFSRLMAERVVDEAAKLYLDIKTGTAQANIAQMQRRSDSLLYLLNRKSYSVAASQPLDINPGVKSAAVPVEIAIRDRTVLATLYAEIVKNLETSKLLLSQQTPVIQILDKPGRILMDSKTSLALLTVIFSAGALVVCLLFLFGAFYFTNG